MNTSKFDCLILPSQDLILQLEEGFKPCSPRSWSRDIKKLYKNTCVVTGLPQFECELASHHLFSKKQNPHLQYSLLNGLPLAKQVHKAFHKNCGMHTCPIQLKKFLEINIRYLKNSEGINNFYPEINDLDRLEKLVDWIIFLETEMSRIYTLS